MDTNAQALFDSVLSGGSAEIERMIEEEEHEYFILDFKQKTRSKDQKKDGPPWEVFKADKETLAEALSGFANSAGGVVIWGVAEDKDKAGRIIGREPACIPQVVRFVAALNRLTNQVVSPPVDGVVHTHILTSDGDSEGYAVTYVPQSPKIPHQAQAGLLHYFKRYTDEFKRMHHYELEDAFGRRQRPDLVVAEMRLAPPDVAPVYRRRPSLAVRNEGRAVALHYGIDIALPDAIELDTRHAEEKAPTSTYVVREPGLRVIKVRNAPDGLPLFPEETVRIWQSQHYGSISVLGAPDAVRPYEEQPVTYRLYADNMRMREHTVRLRDLMSEE